jgi:hypothetical protein
MNEPDEMPAVIVTPAAGFYLCEPISRDMFNVPGRLALAPAKMPTMPLSISKVVAMWKPDDKDEEGDPIYTLGDVIIHRESAQNTFRPDPRSPPLLFVHFSMIVGKVRGLVKDEKEDKKEKLVKLT